MDNAPTNTNAAYGFFDARDFLALELPERQPLLAPWLLEGSINLIYAKPGVGKTNFALGLAVALVRGEAFLGFPAARPCRVLYVDGEMGKQELQRRLKALTGEGELPEGFYLVCNGAAEPLLRMGQLNTAEGQADLERMILDAAPDVIILDNKSTLMSNQRENEAGSWDSTQSWLITLRNCGHAVIMLHHAGKNGSQRGTSALEVSPDIVMELYEPDGKPPAEGSQFVLSFDKQRHLQAKDAQPLMVSLLMEGNSATWGCVPFEGMRKVNPRKQEAVRLVREENLTLTEVADRLEVDKSTVSRWMKAEGGDVLQVAAT